MPVASATARTRFGIAGWGTRRLASTTPTPSIAWTGVGAPYRSWLYVADNWATTTFRMEIMLRAIAGEIYARLYDETAAGAAVNSQVSHATSTTTRVQSSAITLVDGNTYRIQTGVQTGEYGEAWCGVLINYPRF